MYDAEIAPSRGYYALAALVVLAGVALSVWNLWHNLRNINQSLTQIVVPGQQAISLPQSGDYTIFYEYESVVGNRVYSTGPSLPRLECSLRAKATGELVPLSPSSAKASYSTGSRSGVSVWRFRLTRPGLHEFSCHYPEGEDGHPVVLAVDHGFMRRLFMSIGGTLALLFGSMIAGLAIFLATLLKRSATKKRALQSLYPPPIG